MKKFIVFLALAAMASPAMAKFVVVNSVDTPWQDPLILHHEVHELGTAFPPGELITVMGQTTSYRPCFQNPDDPSIPNIKVTIVNQTGKFWRELVYVADPETSLTNDDGTVNGELAFNIDSIGPFNFPLVFESGVIPNVFEPGEMWQFVIQDYVNITVPPVAATALGSVGLVGMFSGGVVASSGSIIAVPEPATLAVLGLCGLALIRRRRR